jgi:hypothetical protein
MLRSKSTGERIDCVMSLSFPNGETFAAYIKRTGPEARAFYARHGIGSLLARPIANPKVAKGLDFGFLTAPMHLAPSSLGGFNVCPKATAGCKAACLHTAGNPAYMAGKARSRVKKTRAYFTDRDAFMVALTREIAKHALRAAELGMVCGVRLNATSDIRWETVPVMGERNIMSLFPNTQFYDYSKISNRRNLPPNYHLTFSLAENNDADALRAHVNGLNVAVAFDVPRGKPLPVSYVIEGHAIPVIDGDEHDYRPADPRGVIVGLRAKGRAIGDKSGFVRHAT